MERKILELITRDRLELPLSSIEQKLRRTRTKIAKNISEYCKNDSRFVGERSYAFSETEDKERARGMKEAVAEFSEDFPKYGKILQGKIAEKRTKAEKHLYFGMNEGCRLTAEDYLGVMQSLGLSERVSRALYPELMEVSRKLSKARNEDRSVIVGSYNK